MNTRSLFTTGLLYRLNSNDEHTTLTDDNAINNPANHGGNLKKNTGYKAPAAIGIPNTLYPIAKT